MADWHYIGHYGQLGPLSDSQMAELIAGGVIERNTYVWCDGMPDWLVASAVVELTTYFSAAPSPAAPPPPPPPGSAPGSGPKPFGTGLGVIGREIPGGYHVPPPGPTGPPPMGGQMGGAGGLGGGYYATPGAMGSPGLYGPGYGQAIYPSQKSDKNKIVGGILNIILPGVGRMYLGYPVIGVLQFVTMFCGVGVFWALVDGFLILTGNVKEDGYGRELL